MALIDCFTNNLITEETANLYATSKSKLRAGIDRAKKLAGIDETNTGSLKLQTAGFMAIPQTKG
jgi:hypothetical protein